MLAQFITVWTEMITFFVGLFTNIQAVFWNAGENEPTFVGLCTLAALAISFFSFVIGIIINAIRMRS